ncbi:MAG: Hsp70 family protein, partial [Gemmatimonadetes bacterium]|nr:Hsp70 family protein [Gemmatimonadota bacterium]
DANGILHVSAQDKATGKEQKIRIEASSGLEENEIEQMIKDAESHAAGDRERREKVEIRNQADSLIYQTEKSLADLGDKVSADQRARVDAAVERTREALKHEDSEDLKSATHDLQQLWHSVAQEAYQASASPEGEPTDEPAAGDSMGPETVDEDVIEADYEVVDEEK